MVVVNRFDAQDAGVASGAIEVAFANGGEEVWEVV